MTVKISARKKNSLLVAGLIVASLIGCQMGMPVSVACSQHALVSVQYPFRWEQGRIWLVESDNVTGTVIQLNPATGDIARSAVLPATTLAELGYEAVTWTAIDVSQAGQLFLSYAASPSITSVEIVEGTMIVSNGTLRLVKEHTSNGAWIDDTTIAFLHLRPPGLFWGVRQSLHIESIENDAGDRLTTVPIHRYRSQEISSFVVDATSEGFWYETTVYSEDDAGEALAYQTEADSTRIDLDAFCIQPLQAQQVTESGPFVFSAKLESYDLFIVENDSTRAEHLLPVTPDVDETHPAWSASGEEIAYVATRTIPEEGSIFGKQVQDLMIYNVESRQSYLVAEFDPTSRISWPIWSPDGKQLAFLIHAQAGSIIDTNATIAVYDVQTQSLQYYSP